MFIFTGWDGALYVNEEVRQRRRNPGRAALLAVALLAVIYTLSMVGLQGTVRPAKLQLNAASALVYTAQALGLVFLASARFVQRSQFFGLPREQYQPEPATDA